MEKQVLFHSGCQIRWWLESVGARRLVKLLARTLLVRQTPAREIKVNFHDLCMAVHEDSSGQK